MVTIGHSGRSGTISCIQLSRLWPQIMKLHLKTKRLCLYVLYSKTTYLYSIEVDNNF